MTIELPLESPVLIVAVAMAVFLGAPLLFRRMGAPGTVGVLLAGTVLGPHGIGLLARSETIVLLGTVGILYLMFVAALEIDMGGFVEAPGRSAVFGLVSFALPLVAGVGAGFVVFGYGLATSLLFAAVFSSHTILAYPVIEELNLGKSRAVTTAVSATLFTDTAALLVLAWAVGSEGAGGGGGEALRLLGGLALLAAATWLLVPRLARWFFLRSEAERYFEFLFSMVVLFAASALAELVGLEPLIGAFLAGLGLNRRVTAPSTLQNRIDFAGNALFIPFFLFSVGMLVDPSVFVEGTGAWLVGGLLILLVAATKFAAAWLAGTLYGFDPVETRTAFALTIGQASAALAITLIGFDRGLFDETVMNGVVIMVAATAVVSPMLSERFGATLSRRERRRKLAEGASQRILVPILGGESHLEALVELAMLLKDPESEEPIRVVHAVERARPESGPVTRGRASDAGETPGEATAEDALVEAEAVLEHLEDLGAGAEVAIDTQTRTDEDRVHGIVRAVEDNRITTLVTEWREPPRYGSRLLDPPAEKLVRETDLLLLAARLPEALEAVNRVVAVVPAALLTHPGLPGGLRAVRALAARMDTPQRYLLLDGDGGVLEAMLEETPPEAPFEVQAMRGPAPGRDAWPPGGPEEAALEEGDAPVIFLPRPDGPYWATPYEALPALAEEPRTANAILLFPAEAPSRYRTRHFLRFS